MCRYSSEAWPVSTYSSRSSGAVSRVKRPQNEHWKSENSMMRTGAAGLPSIRPETWLRSIGT